MRIFLVLICSLALASVAGAQQEKKKEQGKKKAAPSGQVSQPQGKTSGKPAGAGKPTYATKPAGKGKPAETGKPTYATKPAGKGKPAETGKPTYAAKPAGKGKPAETGKPTYATKPAGKGKPAETGKPTYAGKPAEKGKPAETGKPTRGAKAVEAGKPAQAAKIAGAGKPAKPFKPQHFNLPKQPKTAVAPPVRFEQNRRIQGSDKWVGTNYQVFRNYRSEWHDRNWWRHHHSRIVFVFGGWYFWNAGYWFPAWGYDSGAYYPYDGPIYGYNNLPPDQVTANVQAALQEQGYYHGEVDGLLGPLTRAAIADYQRDRGLYMTSAIDRPTLQSLGMA